jgi:hypothetical protein
MPTLRIGRFGMGCPQEDYSRDGTQEPSEIWSLLVYQIDCLSRTLGQLKILALGHDRLLYLFYNDATKTMGYEKYRTSG